MRAIDADTLKDRLQAIANDDWNQRVSTTWANAYTDFADMVEDMPTIEPERKGKWEIKKASIYPYGNDVCCSECGHTLGSSFGYKFCPMCGCKMEEQDDG